MWRSINTRTRRLCLIAAPRMEAVMVPAAAWLAVTQRARTAPAQAAGMQAELGGGAAMSRLMQQQDWFQLSSSQESRSSRAAACLCTGQPVAPTWGLSERLPRVGSRFPSQVGMSVRVCLDCVSLDGCDGALGICVAFSSESICFKFTLDCRCSSTGRRKSSLPLHLHSPLHPLLIPRNFQARLQFTRADPKEPRVPVSI